MTILRALAPRQEQRGRAIGDGGDPAILVEGGRSRSAAANERAALGVPAYYAGVTTIAETVGMLPLDVRRRTPDGVVETVSPDDDRLAHLLGVSANEEQSAGDVWESVTASLLLRGNAYLWRQRDDVKRVVGLWPLRADRVQVQRDQKTGRKVFLVSSSSDDAVQYVGTTFDVLHITGLSFNGLTGETPIRLYADLLDRAKGESTYQRSLLDNGVRPSGVLTMDGELSPEAAEKLKKQWQAAYGGVAKAGRTPVLEEGLKWQTISLTAADAQLLQQRQFTRQEIAMVLRMPAHMLLAGEGGGLHYTSASMDLQYYAQHTIAPRCSRIARALRHDAELPWGHSKSGGTLFPRFDLDALTEADPTTRYQNYLLARQGGWANANELPRRREGLRPIEGGDALPPVKAGGEVSVTEPNG